MLEKNIEICYNESIKAEKAGVAIMHKIISNYLSEFCDDNFISPDEKESKKFEYFINYCIACSKYCDDVDIMDITTQEDDAGIDGILIFIDGELVSTDEEAKKSLQVIKRI